jgi:hypothetical protein
MRILRWLAEMWRLSGTVWAYRHLRVGRVSQVAKLSLIAAQIVEDLRKRYP